MISVIIPTYKSTEHLKLCLESAIKGQSNPNQIIVVVDGTIDIVQPILDEYTDEIEILDMVNNQGLCAATNFGVYNAKSDLILIVNDDNVFPDRWDDKLNALLINRGRVYAPNQVEPHPSMFNQFVISNMGTTPSEFDLQEWYDFTDEIFNGGYNSTNDGSTLPIFMYKDDYMMIGGWDERYPNGMVADWDFFLKCNLAGFEMLRANHIPFYHFASASVNSKKRMESEMQGHGYARYKWGTPIKHNPSNNEKYL